MTKAFENAKRLCNDWINWGNHRDCHPPIIINITDGEATDAGSSFNALKNQVEQIKSLRTNYGSVNILNIHISTRAGDKLLFPNEVNTGDKFEKLLFEMRLPGILRHLLVEEITVHPFHKILLNIGTPQ